MSYVNHVCQCAACNMRRSREAKAFDEGHAELVKIVKKMKAEKDAAATTQIEDETGS
jgi:hypothetical protein